MAELVNYEGEGQTETESRTLQLTPSSLQLCPGYTVATVLTVVV